MIVRIGDEGFLNLFKSDSRAIILSASAINSFHESDDRNRLLFFKLIFDGEIHPLMLSIEVSKAKKLYEREWRVLYERISSSKSSIMYIMRLDLHRYEIIDEYEPLFNLMRKNQIHPGDVSSIIASIEYGKPLVTDDDLHVWKNITLIDKVSRRRSGRNISLFTSRDAKVLIKRLGINI